MLHIVEYEKWCNTCKFRNKNEDEEPCDMCLSEPVKEDGKRPVYYVEDKNLNKKKGKKNESRR